MTLRSRAVRGRNGEDGVPVLAYHVILRDRPDLRGRGDAPGVETVLTPIRVRTSSRTPEVPEIRRWDIPVALISAVLGLLLGQLLF